MIDPRKLLVIGLSALALALAGCGGGGDTTAAAPATVEETTESLSKDELIAQGDGICAEVNAAVGTVGGSEASGVEVAAQVADLYGGMVDRLKALGTPDESSGYSEFIEAADELAQAESDAQLAAERGDEATLTEAQANADSALSSFQEAASSYGFEDCAEAPSAPTIPAAGGAEPAEEEAAPEVEVEAEAAPEEVAPEEAAPETGGAGGTAEEGGGTGTGGGGETGGGSGGIGPG